MSKEKPRNPARESKKVDSLRVVRGGFWNNSPYGLKSASRNFYYPSYRDSNGGFRIARTVKK